MRTISGEELRRMLRSAVPPRLVHAGGPAAFRDAHIPGSETFGSAEDVVALLGGDAVIVVYADAAGREKAHALAVTLAARLGSEVRWYVGGLDEWVRAGGPVEGRCAPGEPGARCPTGPDP